MSDGVSDTLSDATERRKTDLLYCRRHGPVRMSEALVTEASTGRKFRCPVPNCGAFLGANPPTQDGAGSKGIPSRKSTENRYCANCGNVQDIRLVPSKSGILKICNRCGGTTVPLDSELLDSLPPPPSKPRPLFEELMDDNGMTWGDDQAQRLSDVLRKAGLGKGKVDFIGRLFTSVPSYRSPEGLHGLLSAMRVPSSLCKLATDYVLASGTHPNVEAGGHRVAEAGGRTTPLGGLRDRLIEASIVARELQLLGLVPSGSVGVDAKGNPIIQPAKETTPEDLFRYFSQGMEMAIKLGGGQGGSLEDEVKRLKAIQSLTSPTTESAEVAGIYGRVELEKLKEQRRHEMALAEAADKRSQAERSQATVDGAVKVGLEVVKEIAEPLGATLAGGVKNLVQQQGQEGQGPTPADQLSPEQRAEVLQKIEIMRGQLDAREREVQSMDAPSVQMEVVREKPGAHVDVHEAGGP